MGINLRGVQMVVPQDFLNCPDIHTVLQHQRGGGMAQLVGRILGAVDSSFAQALFHHGVNRGTADAFVLCRQKQCVGISACDGPPDSQPAFQRVLTGVIQINDAHFIAFAQHPQGIVLDVAQVQANQLRNSQTAIEE